MKVCTVCKIQKPYEEFHKKSSSKDGTTYRCKICDSEYSTRWAQKNRERARELGRKAHNKKKLDALIYYSKGILKCACKGCNITNPIFLTIDHIKEGAAHKKEHLGGSNAHIYRWLQKNNYPPGFQVLCFNCNCSKRNNEHCPVHNIESNILISFDPLNQEGNRFLFSG